MPTYGASEFRWMQSKGIRPGRLLAERGTRVPAGLVHAIDDTGTSLCGLADLEQIDDPPIAWGSRSMLDECRQCQSLAATST